MTLYNVEVQVEVEALHEDHAYQKVYALMLHAEYGNGVRGFEILEDAVTTVGGDE